MPRATIIALCSLFLHLNAFATVNNLADFVLLTTHSATIRIPVHSWKKLRDDRITKQDLDFSCGAASLATLLNSHYGQKVTEAEILKVMDKQDARASFMDMARAAEIYGFKAQGFAASWEQLVKLKMPVIVYVKHRRDGHFSVLRGIDSETVWLADPSLGNRTYSRQQFLQMWQTREESSGTELVGKFLAVLPARSGSTAAEEFFSRTPKRQSKTAVDQLSFRPWR